MLGLTELETWVYPETILFVDPFESNPYGPYIGLPS